MESLQISDINKNLPEILSPYFEGFMTVLPNTPSFYVSLSYTLLQSVIKHKVSDQGSAFISSLYSLIQKVQTQNKELNYLQILIEHLQTNPQFDDSNFANNLKSTEGAFTKLGCCLSLIYNHIIEEDSTSIIPISLEYSKTQILKLIRALRVAAIISFNDNIEYLNQEEGRIMIWMHQVDKTWSILIPKQGMGFPYFYQELKENYVNKKHLKCIEEQIEINKTQVQISDAKADQLVGFITINNEVIKISEPVELLMKNNKHLRDYTHYLPTFPENLSFYSGFIISLLSSIKKLPKSEEFKQSEILNKLITQAHLSGAKDYLIFFRDLLNYIKNSNEPIDIIGYLKSNPDALLYLNHGLKFIVNHLLNSSSLDYYLIHSEKHHNLLENLCKMLEIKLYLSTALTLHTFGLATSNISVSLMEQNNIFYCLLLKSPAHAINRKKMNKAVEALWESLSSSKNVSMAYEIQINLEQYINENNISLSDPLTSKAKSGFCSMHRDQKNVYITECNHAACIPCLVSQSSTQFICTICKQPLSKSIYPKLLKGLYPSDSPFASISNKLSCNNCHKAQPLQHFQAISCPKNCKICLKCRIKSKSEVCSCCQANYKPFQQDILNSIASSMSCRADAKENIICVICFKVVNQGLKSCCDVCVFCNFNSMKCLVCAETLQRKPMNCFKCQKEIQEKKDMNCCSQCTSMYHIFCFDYNYGECESCSLKRFNS